MNNQIEQKITKVTPLAYLIIFLATCFYFYEYFLQISPSIMTHELMRDLSISAGTLGTVSAFYYYTYTLFQVPAGLLYDRYGARRILTIAAIICASGAMLFGATNSIIMVSLGRLLMGGASAFAFVGSLYLILRWFPIHYFPILTGFTQVMGSLGAIFGAAPLAALNHKLGWQHSILLMSIIGFVLALIIFLVVRNNPKNSHYTATQNKDSMRKNLMKVLLNKKTWPIALYSCLIWAPIAAFAGLWGVPFLAEKFGVSTIDAAKMIAAVWVGVAVGCPLIGFTSERIYQRRLPLTVVALLGLAATLTLLYLPNLPYAFGCLLLFFLGVSASGQSLAFAMVTDINTLNTAPAGIGFNNMCVVCGAIFSQPLIGQLLDLNWTGTLLNGVPSYSLSNYQTALFVLPICFLVCAFTSIWMIGETFPKDRIINKAHS